MISSCIDLPFVEYGALEKFLMLHVHMHREFAFPRSLVLASVVIAAEDARGVDAYPVSVLLVDFQQNVILELLAANAAEAGFGFFVVHVLHVIR